MKKKICAVVAVLMTTASFAQNEEMHEANIVGSLDLGLLEVTIIHDEISGCERKTSPHSKNLFVPGEQVQIRITANEQMAEVIKPSLPEQVFTNKICNDGKENIELIFSDAEIAVVDSKVNILQRSMLDLTKNTIVRGLIAELVQDEMRNEKIYMSELEQELSHLNVNLLEIMRMSLTRHGGSNEDIEVLTRNYKQLEVNGSYFDVFIFVPFSDEVDYELDPIVTTASGKKDKVDGIKLNENNDIKLVNITKPVANQNQVWVISMSKFNLPELFPALIWQKCHCSRDTRHEGNILTRGRCSRTGTCSSCGRANIRGVCPDGSCPGC